MVIRHIATFFTANDFWFLVQHNYSIDDFFSQVGLRQRKGFGVIAAIRMESWLLWALRRKSGCVCSNSQDIFSPNRRFCLIIIR
jgi:hypothetical protein